MVTGKRFSYSYWVFVLFSIGLMASCTNILGIDTDYADNPCTNGQGLPPLQCGEGACRVFQDACDANGLPVTECKPTAAKDADTCGDGVDNDCDGTVDENDSGMCTCTADAVKECYRGAPATRNKGICVDGQQSCQAGTWGQCSGDTLPIEEIANGLDDDCDGSVDEGLPCNNGDQQYCYGAAETTINVGNCKQGTQVCKDGVWQKCTGQILPSIETCNGFDDDCDGIEDDLGEPGSPCVCANGETQACYTNPMTNEPIACPQGLLGACKCGERTCSNGKYGPCIGAVLPANSDLCDGTKDDDCNGEVDNISDPSSPCECLSGSTQECYSGDANTLNVGTCKAGNQLCVNGKWGPCNGQKLPTNEVCDGTNDDDCNGSIDNIGLPNSPCECLTGSTQQCYTGPAQTLGVGTCIPGEQTCNTGKWGTCNGQKLPLLEICDGLDNDCNGLPDDGVPGVGDPCFLPQYANTPCHGGTIKCQIGDSVPKCVSNVTPGSVQEACNGIDDNCDNLVDNGFFCCPGDGKKSGNETDLDCGGSCPIKCTDGKGCNVGIDCVSQNCFQNACVSPTCDDKVKNGGEADVDCGLVCINKCLVGQNCNVDSDCISSLCQAANKKCIQKDIGAVCNTNQECASGYCVDNVCCNASCNGVCEACTTQKKGGGQNGLCGPVADNTDPDAECNTDLSSSCQNTGVCLGGSCAKYPAGTLCQTATCTGPNTVNQADTCDGNGACVPVLEKDCTPYACVGNACKAACVTDGECASGYYCNAPQCQIKKQLGQACLGTNECQSGNCIDGVCCNTNCAGTCLACNVAGSIGTCSPIVSNADPSNECNPGECDGAGQCEKGNGASCTQNSQCVSGNCIDGVCCNTGCVGTCVACDNAGSVGVCSNIPANADPANECNPGACNGNGDCQGTSTPCSMPSQCASNFCVDGYCCDTACSGTCEACSGALKGAGQNGVCGPIASNLDPNNECNPGACNGSNACQSNNGTSCMSDVQCASGHCVDGVCCNTACGGTCQACNLANNVGTCVSVPANQDPASECNPGSCDGAGQCQVGQGSSCSNAGQCTTGFCADGVCCDQTCSGLCQACTTALKGSGNNGECGPIIANTDPQNECDQEPVSTCGKTGFCSGAGSCALYANGSICTPASCMGASKVNASTCNGSGICSPGATQTCGNFGCNAGTCNSTCTADVDCASGNYCAAPTCMPKVALGGTCSASNQCSSGFCIDGVCCSTDCSGECKTCALAGSLGTCVNVPAGSSDPTPSCQGVQTCNGAGKCVYNNGQACVSTAECLSGNCVDGVCCNTACNGLCNACSAAKTGGTSGTCAPVQGGLDPDNECTGATVCNGANACTQLGVGAACAADAECSSTFCRDGVCCSTTCTGACKACNAAKTGGVDGSCANIATNTDPDNECTTECGSLGSCEVPNGTACLAGSECQSGNCVDGVCCNNACSGDCQTCNKAGSVGTCSPVAAGQQDTCGAGALCDAAGTCKKTNGSMCSLASECQSGFCADGFCCGAACNGTCESCNQMMLQGTCTPIASGLDPSNECAGTDVCNGANACVKANGSTCSMASQCLSNSCVDGVCCAGACAGTCKACNVAGAEGTCSNILAGQDPANECAGTTNVCDGNGTCKQDKGGTCATTADCLTGLSCSPDGVCCDSGCGGLCEACLLAKTGVASGTCAPVMANTDLDNECANGECTGNKTCELGNGASCSTNADCQSGACADGVCCDMACNGGCQACNLVGSVGTCTSYMANTDPEGACVTECNGLGACEAANGTACGMNAALCESGNCVDGFCCDGLCNGTCEACSAALTGGTNGTCSNITANTDPGDECTGGECNGSGVCEALNGVICSTSADCISGACSDGVCCNTDCSGGCRACNLGGTEGTCINYMANTDPELFCAGAIDCNGNGACELANGAACSVSTDCQSGVCMGTCQAPTCYDMVQNGNETAVDCGGTCGPCRLLLAASDATNTAVGEFNADNASPTWTLTTKTGFMSGAPGIAVTNTGYGVVAIRNDGNGSKLSSLTWSAAGGFGASFTLAGGGAGFGVDTTPALRPVGLTSQVISAFHTTTSGPTTGYIKFGQVDASTGTWSPSNEAVLTLTDNSNTIVPDIVDLSSTTPYVVYPDGGGTKNLIFRQRVAAGTWTTTGNVDPDVTLAPPPAIVRLKDNRLLVVFTDSDGKLYSRVRSVAGAWGAVSAASIGTSGFRPSLTALADPMGNKAMVAFINASGNAVVSTCDPNTNTWTAPVDVSGAATTGGIISIARGLNGKVAELIYVLNNAGKDMVHARFDGTSWATSVVSGGANRVNLALGAPPLP